MTNEVATVSVIGAGTLGKQIAELAPLRTDFVQIRYASATELFNLFNEPVALCSNDSADCPVIFIEIGQIINPVNWFSQQPGTRLIRRQVYHKSG